MGISISDDLVSTIRGHIDGGATAIEDSAGSAPSGVDGGEMSAKLASMLNRACSAAADLSEGASVISANVETAGADFWRADGQAQEDSSAVEVCVGY